MHAYPRMCLHLTVTSRGKMLEKTATYLNEEVLFATLENKGSTIPRRGLFGHRPTGAQR